MSKTTYFDDATNSFNLNSPRNTMPMHKMLSISSMSGPYLKHGTNAIWEPISNTLLFVDVYSKKIVRYNPQTHDHDEMVLDQLVGFAVPTSQCTKSTLRLFVGLEDSIVEVDFTRKIVMRTIGLVSEDLRPNGRFNGGKCSPNGVLYVNFVQTIPMQSPIEFLFRLQIAGRIGMNAHLQLALGPKDAHMPDFQDKHTSQGMAWFGERVFLIESTSMTSSIVCYKVHGDTQGGHLFSMSKMGVVYSLPSKDVQKGQLLDGLTIDSDGKLWACVSEGGFVIRIDPLEGREVQRVHVPSKKPSCCSFGTFRFSMN